MLRGNTANSVVAIIVNLKVAWLALLTGLLLLVGESPSAGAPASRDSDSLVAPVFTVVSPTISVNTT
ncbi:MAG: hypothetical protein HYY04_15500 [Chloroflexi bacterium]|nr:hypothetical protein [Chloroflexota bacterium]